MVCIRAVMIVRRLLSIVTRRSTFECRKVPLSRPVHAELTFAFARLPLSLGGMQLRLRTFKARLGMSIPFRLESCDARLKNVRRTTLTACNVRPGFCTCLMEVTLASYSGTVLHRDTVSAFCTWHLLFRPSAL